MSSTPLVLVADDESAITALVYDMLSYSGFQVLRAHGGSEALRIARAERPDLVLLDVMMPDMDGRDACSAIRSDPDLEKTRVVLFSSVEERDLDWSACGADAFLQKPFSIRALPEFIRKVLQGQE